MGHKQKSMDQNDDTNEKQIEGYVKIDRYDQAKIDRIASHYAAILEDLGEDPSREGLLKTPERVAKALQYLTHGYDSKDRKSVV